MKRLAIVAFAAAATLTLAFGAATTKAFNGGGGYGGGDHGKQLTITGPSTLAMNATGTFQVSLSNDRGWDGPLFAGKGGGGDDHHGLKNVVLKVYPGDSCRVPRGDYGKGDDHGGPGDHGGHGGHGGPSWPVTYKPSGEDDGVYSFDIKPADFTDEVGDFSLKASADNVEDSDCFVLQVTANQTESAPRGPIGVFLCYSKYQVVPGVWPFGMAQQLMAGGGYWLPYAVPGTVPFGTNIGNYHLICNPASTQSANGSVLGAGENVYSPDVAKAAIGDAFGPFYPVVGG